MPGHGLGHFVHAGSCSRSFILSVSSLCVYQVGVVNKLVTVLLNCLLWDHHASSTGIIYFKSRFRCTQLNYVTGLLSLVVCVAGAAFYQQVILVFVIILIEFIIIITIIFKSIYFIYLDYCYYYYRFIQIFIIYLFYFKGSAKRVKGASSARNYFFASGKLPLTTLCLTLYWFEISGSSQRSSIVNFVVL